VNKIFVDFEDEFLRECIALSLTRGAGGGNSPHPAERSAVPRPELTWAATIGFASDSSLASFNALVIEYV
jgi:hypothetical protein